VALYGEVMSLYQSLPFPIPLESYKDQSLTSLKAILWHRLQIEPLNGIATLIFIIAIFHTFFAGAFIEKSKHLHHYCKQNPQDPKYSRYLFKAELLHLLGEVEAVFGLWAIPLMITVIYYRGTAAAYDYLNHQVNFNEAMFVVVIMSIASSYPIIYLTERCLQYLARFGKYTVSAWWMSILTFTPLLGSFITEPAAMTLAASLLAKKFYVLQPSKKLSYATLGLLFVNISIGGTLSHFAAPPILMISQNWNWGFYFTFIQCGQKALLALLLSTVCYYFIFRKELKTLNASAATAPIENPKSLPIWTIGIHVGFLAWTVFNLHYPVLYIGGFLFFLAFTQATAIYQSPLQIRSALLVGFFLAGLVIHGGLQQWWLSPILGSLTPSSLFISSIILTSFNDNAAITYLASLVPSFKQNVSLQLSVVQGAVTGGGLTVIANAPNPAGQAILGKFFMQGIKPMGLFLAALIPTIIAAICFRL
jgi:hypothetical protein